MPEQLDIKIAIGDTVYSLHDMKYEGGFGPGTVVAITELACVARFERHGDAKCYCEGECVCPPFYDEALRWNDVHIPVNNRSGVVVSEFTESVKSVGMRGPYVAVNRDNREVIAVFANAKLAGKFAQIVSSSRTRIGVDMDDDDGRISVMNPSTAKVMQAWGKSAKRRDPIGNAVRVKVFEKDRFRCVYCGRGSADDVVLHVDHKHPVSKGGTNDMDNLQTLCSDCNAGKTDRIVEVA